MLLTPEKTLAIAHRAYLIERALDGSRLAVAAGSKVSIVDKTSSVKKLGLGSDNVKAVSLNASGSILAVAHAKQLTVTIFGDEPRRVVIDSPELFGETGSLERGYDDCYFDQWSNLWSVAPLSPYRIELQCREPDEWAVIERTVIDDPFGYSSSSFHSTPDPDVHALWVAAGQDGQKVYWVSADGDLVADEEEMLCNTTPPVFAPNGNELLVSGENGTVDRYSFPDINALGSCQSPFLDDDMDSFGESIAYIDNAHALVSSSEGRLFLLQAASASILEEVEVLGHEPRRCCDVYPSLAKETHMCSDISYFKSCGDTLFMVFRRDSGVERQGWKDSLLCFSLKSLSQSLKR